MAGEGRQRLTVTRTKIFPDQATLRDRFTTIGSEPQVAAAEPTPELRAHGQRLHTTRRIEWIDDHLPDLPVLRERGLSFDLILLTAVWMHLAPSERPQAMNSIVGLLAPEGLVVMVLRHGPVPAGRRMFDVSAQETVELAADFGLSPVHHGCRPDLHGRDAVHMSTLGLQVTAHQ